jgi:ribose 5-phosphate isomerase B
MIAIASDHAGLSLKEAVKAHLTEQGVAFEDFGTDTAKSCDYTDFALLACGAVRSGWCKKAMLFCGTGVGMSMAANKLRDIRAAVASDCYSVKYTRLHNDANVLCLGSRVVGPGLACELADIFLDTDFEGGRHAERVEAVMKIHDM